jgi:DNA-binding YbaB/EbfC family protein
MAKGRRGGFPGPAGGNNMNQILKQAQKMQEQIAKAQEEAEAFTGEAEVGGGMVKVSVSAEHQITSIEIKPEVVDPDDVEMLEDLVTAAINEAMRQVDEKTAEHMGKATGALGGLGGLGGFGF